MKLRTAFLALFLAASTQGCSKHSVPAQSPAQAAPAKPQVLERSLFSKDSRGSLTEADLQKVLEAPIDLQFPARVGVVPLAQAFEPGEDVSIGTRSVASEHLAQSLIGSPQFSHVSDVSTELPHVGGIEGLRVLAARYRLRYLLLYSERFENDSHLNGWAWLYPTVLGVFLSPGVTVESRGVAQADLLDVRTGTILFTVVEPMKVSSKQLAIGAPRAHRRKQAKQAAGAAKRLADRVSAQANALVAYAEGAASGKAAKYRVLPSPIAPEPAPTGDLVGSRGEALD